MISHRALHFNQIGLMPRAIFGGRDSSAGEHNNEKLPVFQRRDPVMADEGPAWAGQHPVIYYDGGREAWVSVCACV